jgi:hypothetical protein
MDEKYVIEVPYKFLPLTQIPPMKQMKTHVLNLKKLKTQIPIMYLTFFFFFFCALSLVTTLHDFKYFIGILFYANF